MESLRFPRSLAAAFFSIPFLLSGPLAHSQTKADDLAALKTIFDEVKEMGARRGEDFIKGEFFIGAPDDDDTNKDTQAVVLIQTVDGSETMLIQVTYMERTRENPRIKIAKETKNLTCRISGHRLSVVSSDYEEQGLHRLAADLLQSIRDKKKLLRKIPAAFS
jgi:hypothetical protein